MDGAVVKNCSPDKKGADRAVAPLTNDYPVSKTYAWYVFFLVSALMLFDFMDRQVIAALFPYFKKEWGISDTQCGVLVAAVNWSITAFAVPVGVLADRWSRKKTVGLMSMIWSLATIVCAFTTNFKQLLAARFVIGVGEAGYVPVGNALISALFPKRLRGRITGIFIAAAGLGSSLGIMLGGWIGVTYGWRHAFGIVGVPGLIFAILFFFIRDYKTVELTVSDPQSEGPDAKRTMTKKEIAKILLCTPSLMATYLGSVMALFFTGIIINWTASFFHRVHNLPIAEASTKAGLVMIVGIVGKYAGGALADWLVERGHTNGRLLSAATMQFCAFLCFSSALCLAQGSTQIALVILSGFFYGAHNGPVYSCLPELVHSGLRVTVVSVMTFFQNVLGFALGPIFVGVVSDRYGLETAMIVASFVPIIGAACFWIGSRFYARDMAKAQQAEVVMEA